MEKAVTGQLKRSNHPLHAENRIAAQPQEKTEVFADLLERVHQHDQHPQQVHLTTERTVEMFLNTPVLYQQFVEEAEVVEAIATPKRNTAPGQDGISYAMLKQLLPTAVTYLTSVYNSCLTIGYHPPAWRSAKVIMIPKPFKNPTNPSSYRPISLLSCFSKIYEKIIQTKPLHFCDENQVIPDLQLGFRSKRSLQNALLHLVSDITETLNKGEYAAAAFLDIERAFDRVWHAGLIHKLLLLNTPCCC